MKDTDFCIVFIHLGGGEGPEKANIRCLHIASKLLKTKNCTLRHFFLGECFVNQFAWLDFFEGRWLLLNGNIRYPARSWSNEDTALAVLRDEGWTIAGPLGKRAPKKRSKRTSYGYALMRTVH
jgi:hypothetical protein